MFRETAASGSSIFLPELGDEVMRVARYVPLVRNQYGLVEGRSLSVG
jgi:hypothetical protein